MLFDNDPMVNQYISLPKELSSLNCAAFVAGIIEGVCDGAGFPTEGVTAHSVGDEEGKDGKRYLAEVGAEFCGGQCILLECS
jgi:hypothetical protein